MARQSFESVAILLTCYVGSVVSELCSIDNITFMYCTGSYYCCGKDRCCSSTFSSTVRTGAIFFCSFSLFFILLIWWYIRCRGRGVFVGRNAAPVAVTVAPNPENTAAASKTDAPPPYSTVVHVTDVNAVPNGFVAYEKLR